MKEIRVGEAATISIGSDCYPATVIDVTPSGKTVTCQYDNFVFIPGSLTTGGYEYSYQSDPNGRIMKFRYSAKYNRWKNSSYRVSFGNRRYYQDPSF